MIEVLDAISAARCNFRRTSGEVESVRIFGDPHLIRMSAGSLDARTIVVVPMMQVVVSQALASAHVD